MNMTQVCDYLTTNPETIIKHFGGMNISEALDYLNDLFPGDDDNAMLAESIVAIIG